MSQNISKCREGYGAGEFAWAAGKGGGSPYGWGLTEVLSLYPGITRQGAPLRTSLKPGAAGHDGATGAHGGCRGTCQRAVKCLPANLALSGPASSGHIAHAGLYLNPSKEVYACCQVHL